MSKWFIASKKADFDAIGKKYGISPIIARIIRNRDVITDEEILQYLAGGLDETHSPSLMKDMNKACGIIKQHIKEKKKIRIIGDYDVDGITSTYILYRGLSFLGANIDYAIPHRITDGYGLNVNLIQNAIEDSVDLILTCDNGIAASEAIAYAKEKGLSVVVTDHHEVPYEEESEEKKYILPPADAIVNPKQPDCNYPFKEICGAVVAFKLIQYMYAEYSIQGKEAILDDLIQFATLGTVCDVMELMNENRCIVKYGLEQIRYNPNIGISALLEANNLKPEDVSSYHIGFIIGPCMNASGRLDTAMKSLELILEDNPEKAKEKAVALTELNAKRKAITEENIVKAKEYVDTNCVNDKVLVVYLPDCHESIAGIVAGKIKEHYHKPVFVLTKTEYGLKGSGRSIESYNMYEHLINQKKYLDKFGGHAMAAGLSLQEEKLEHFRKAINEQCNLTLEDFEEKIVIDVPMPLSYASLELAREITFLEPFGVGNPKPLFAQKNLTFVRGKILGANKNVGKYEVRDENNHTYEMMYFGSLDKFHETLSEKYGAKAAEELYQTDCNFSMDVVYQLGINLFRDTVQTQFTMQAFK